MHKNTPVAEVEIINNIPIEYKKIINKNELPIGTYSPNSLTGKLLFKKWVDSRAIPSARPNIKNLESKLGLNRTELFLKTAGVSINDTYWFCEEPGKVNWEDMNYHDNGFDEVILSMLQEDIIQGLHSPDLTTDGVMDKFWFTAHNKLYLAKIDTLKDGALTANEVLYSTITSSLGAQTTPYFEGHLENIQYCACPGFITSPDADFITAMQLKHEDMRRSGSVLLEYLSKNLGFSKEISEMMTLDCLFHNTDRHEKNFGIIKTNDNISFAPLFDNGYCLGVNHDTMMVSDSDMKLLPDSRTDILARYGVNFDMDSEFVLSELKRIYELFTVPEWRYEKAKNELQAGLQLLVDNKKQYYITDIEFDK